MLNLNATVVGRFRIRLPSMPTQQAYAEAVDAIERSRDVAGAHLDLLDELFASLQQRAFRGDLFSSPLPAELDQLADAVA